jgi:hypothetical protein
MTIQFKILVFLFMNFCFQTFAGELSVDLHKACTSEQLSQHKDIKGHSLGVSDFNEYCSCETDFLIEKATKEQLSQISKKQNKNSNWFKQLKTNALKSCIEPKQQTTT